MNYTISSYTVIISICTFLHFGGKEGIHTTLHMFCLKYNLEY